MKPRPRSGYTFCKCRDCMETVVSNSTRRPSFCHECKAAGCEPDSECKVEHSAGLCMGCDKHT